MRIEVKGRNTPVTDELREHVERRFAKVAQAGVGAGRARDRGLRGAQPGDRRRQVAEATLLPEGRDAARARRVARHARTRSTSCEEELARQVKRHREKRRRRREARGAERPRAAARPAVGAALDDRGVLDGRRRGPPERRRPAREPAATLAACRILDRALRMGEAKKFKAYEQRVERINALRARARARSTDDELRERVDELRERARERRGARRPAARDASRSCARRASARWACATSTCS